MFKYISLQDKFHDLTEVRSTDLYLQKLLFIK